LDPVQTAERTRLSLSTLSKMRVRGDGPPFRKLTAGKVVYAVADVDAWIESKAVLRSTADGTNRRPKAGRPRRSGVDHPPRAA
jgi:predicted DNA-binding transcriptional regulator AlpA